MLQRLHHVAYRCLDAAETVDFYTNVIGIKFAHAISQDRVPSTQEFSPHLHIFFELGDGSYLAFFELAKAPPPQRDPNTPDWVRHLALEVADEAALVEAPCVREVAARIRSRALGALEDGRSTYGQRVKDRVVAGLLPPESSPVEDVSQKVGISVATLERWRAEALGHRDGAALALGSPRSGWKR